MKANYLASPPLVVAYALAGTLEHRPHHRAARHGSDGKPVYLKDIWPTSAEIAELIRTSVTPDMFDKRYANVFAGDERWQAMGQAKPALTYRWDSGSTYVQNPPYFEGLSRRRRRSATSSMRASSALFRDSITTDHISPAGSIKQDGPAGVYLIEHQVRAGRLQLLRRAARQPRRDDARHLRQHPHQEHDAGRQGGRQHHPLSLAASRCRSTTRRCATRRGRAAGGVRRQGVRHRLQPRLGGQGHAPARHARGHRASRSSASTAPTWSAWACCRWCSRTVSRGRTRADW